MIELRPEQRTTVDKAKDVLRKTSVVYIAGEVRVGKTPISIITAKEMGWQRVAIITKKNAISGIVKFTVMVPAIHFDVLNFEQAHKLTDCYDGYIIDEAHACGAFPKPSVRTKAIRELAKNKPVILMSGTPNPESLSQLYHQFWMTSRGPFSEYANFYKFAKVYVNVKKKFIKGFQINDYSEAKADLIQREIEPYMVTLSQEEAGFTSFVEEEILTVQIDERLYKLMKVLKKDKVYRMLSGDVIVADSPVKMQSIFHQLSSGTLKIDDTKRITIDESKAWFIKTKFAGQKIAIFYKFVEEGNVIRKMFPDHTDDPEQFNKHDHLTFICQVVSGREGVNLSTADALVMYNIDFSATSYWQSRARMQTQDRQKASKLYWIFSERGLERFVHKAVVRKQNYTSDYFKKDLKLIGD